MNFEKSTIGLHFFFLYILHTCKTSRISNINCWCLILHAGLWKIKKYYFLSIGLREHLEWCGATRSDIETPKVPFSAKMTKIPLVNSRLTESQMKSKSLQNTTFHSFTSNPSFLEFFGNFNQVWLLAGPRNPNFDLAVRIGWNHCHCEDYS